MGGWGDKGTRRQGDKGTRRQGRQGGQGGWGDKGTILSPLLSIPPSPHPPSPHLPLSPSPLQMLDKNNLALVK
ncbi:hypothetical protein PI95_008040 [Hassallia byssoidea VB512170]|uniref:Uncharacterized protein n=1 Tax=Hassallia byssoidea VB512170 TaxID=1304833 RepID=A0A846H7C5_9CYAN|nr:hypothetical protein [Hassalia byssoidea]NEU72524.1 hypothetical protein [Hassalia byssoidea VB512170]